MSIKLLLIDFSKSQKTLDTAYMKGELSPTEWGKMYEALLDNYSKKIQELVRKEEV